MMLVGGNAEEYEKLKSMPVVDYLVKVDKFTAETEMQIRQMERLKAKSHGRR